MSAVKFMDSGEESVADGVRLVSVAVPGDPEPVLAAVTPRIGDKLRVASSSLVSRFDERPRSSTLLGH
jgi:hypothetical protein